MIPEVEPRIITDAENESVRRACGAFLDRHSFNVAERLIDVEERVAVRESDREFRVGEANGLVRLFLLADVDADGKPRWLSRYVDDWTATDAAIDDLLARPA